MKKITSCTILILLGLTLSASADTNPAQERAHKNAQKSSAKFSRQQKKSMKKEAKALKAYKKKHHVSH